MMMVRSLLKANNNVRKVVLPFALGSLLLAAGQSVLVIRPYLTAIITNGSTSRMISKKTVYVFSRASSGHSSRHLCLPTWKPK